MKTQYSYKQVNQSLRQHKNLNNTNMTTRLRKSVVFFEPVTQRVA